MRLSPGYLGLITGIAFAAVDIGHSSSLAAATGVQASAPAMSDGRAVPARLADAYELLTLAYPEIESQGAALAWNVGTDPISVRVSLPVNPLMAKHGESPQEILTASISLGRHLETFAAAGPLAEGARNAILNTAVRSHPNWLDADIRDQMVALGARNGPDQTFDLDAKVDLRRWQRLLGGISHVRSVAFRWREEGRPVWGIDVRSVLTDGQTVDRRLLFEPFEGRLVGIVRK